MSHSPPDSSQMPASTNDALRILQDVFGYDAFRHHQAAIVDQVVAGGDALVLMPTGGGKSLCYQIPAMLREGTAIVVSPLIALMQDQVDALNQNGVRAACLNSAMGYEHSAATEAALRRGELDLLYMAPERLLLDRTLDLLDNCPIALFAIDEAHCVSQWGHDFRPEYIQLSVLHQRYPDVPRVALTATADGPTRREIIRRLELDRARIFESSFDRPNIRYHIGENTGNGRQQLLRFLRSEHPSDAGIVYCLSRKRVDDIAAWLQQQGLKALPYHAGLSKEERSANQQRFLREDGIIIVATIAFGMGIDKPDVRFVAHLNLPKSIEAYYQETGRAGRDGLAANAWMLYGLQDVITLRQMQAGSQAGEDYKRIERHKLDAMLGLCELTDCRRQALLRYFDEDAPEPCGNCDNCLQPPKTWDATVAAQKALSCVYRTGQRFGVNYLIDVLLGKDNERIRQFKHDTLSTYGIGSEHNANAWRGVFRQLIARGILEVDVEGHGSLHLTEAARPILRGEETVNLRVQPKPTRQRRDRDSAVDPAYSALWEALREHRKALAEEQGVPAYVIFHDATLMEMAERQPQTLDELGHISGVGQRKLDRYGEDFLAVIQDNAGQAGVSNTVAETLRLLEHHSPDAIAQQRQLTPSTVYGHLAEGIENGLLTLEQALSLPQDELDSIRQAIGASEQRRLKPAFDALGGHYDYGVLACVRAAMP